MNLTLEINKEAYAFLHIFKFKSKNASKLKIFKQYMLHKTKK